MPSIVDICNLALARLGDEASVSTIDPPDDSVQANYCATFYPLALQEALDAHDWRFATRRFLLPTRTNDAVDQWAVCYSLPSDYLNMVAIHSPWLSNEFIEYTIEIATDNTRVLYCNAENATLVYVSASVSPQQFSPSFTQYLSAVLASFLAGPILKGDVGVKASNELKRLAISLKETAVERDSLNTRLRVDHTPAAIAARR